MLVKLELAADLPKVFADRVQLQQVTMNLIMNGAEAMQEIEDRPRLLTIRSSLDDAQVAVAVKDCGIGLTAEDQNRLFNAFFSTKPGGLGIGLSICRSIIEAHGGEVVGVRQCRPSRHVSVGVPLTGGGLGLASF